EALAKAELNAETWRVACEREQAQRALPTPSADAQQAVQQPEQPAEQPSRLRRAWRWMRATGCLTGAGLLLVLATGAAGAQQQQQQPQRECFAVAMNTQASVGSILIDKCTGKTWVLTRVNLRGGGYTVRWFPITVETTEGASL